MNTIVNVSIESGPVNLETNIVVSDVANLHMVGDARSPADDVTLALGAALIQLMIELRDDPRSGKGNKRGASIAITQIEAAISASVRARYALE